MYWLYCYITSTYKEYGLKQLWVRVGSGNNQRFIPVHVLGEKLGPEFCKVILKLPNVITLVKKADPVLHLLDFAESNQITE